MSNIVTDSNYGTMSEIKIPRTKDVIRENNFELPKIHEYNVFKNKNYKQNSLKQICKSYKLKVSGNKSDLSSRIYNHLLNSNYAIILQKYFRRHFIQTYFKLIGPALYNRSLCMNSTDFFSLEQISSIPYNEFFSYKDKDNDNSIWGFSIISIYNLFIKSTNGVANPYNRNKINQSCFNDIKHLIKLNNLFNNPINIILNNNNNNTETLSSKKKIEIKCLELFQYIDELGNYTDIKWFTSLNYNLLIHFIRQLRDIWEYRAQLNIEVKKQICHPFGNPFRYIDLNQITNYNLILLQKTALSIIEQFIKKGINREFANLGASYVLCALTLVNVDAAVALPWLYQSVSTIDTHS